MRENHKNPKYTSKTVKENRNRKFIDTRTSLESTVAFYICRYLVLIEAFYEYLFHTFYLMVLSTHQVDAKRYLHKSNLSKRWVTLALLGMSDPKKFLELLRIRHTKQEVLNSKYIMYISPGNLPHTPPSHND